ncbi:hypothetical protein FE391_45365 [Nonomuraea sp. KC401]|uniref:hypothetical protein n=1 Tax=unclassified Nonomuraea TaxID=2593643 RepID=UPI0010FE96CD|nr:MULTISPECIES: hypothetical protein [unclassified Nonomuraea]NBE99686.1 hypothetical protein [Nonomuraea sp. K271]TLF49192.1 hypothetical protein FE391_45365 [Nonomuraea sp. KC401]
MVKEPDQRGTEGATLIAPAAGRVNHGPTSNGHPHLHFELGYDSNGDGSASWGYKGSERVKPMINGVTYGQANGREWNNVESHNCPEPSPEGVASIYGVTPEGRLTYTAIDAATGRRTHGAVHSTAGLGFTPKAMATLNFNTLLVTEDNDPGGKLYRVDIRTNRDTLTFDPPVYLASGYTHDLLAYDGKNHLYGIANGTLRRYTITASKPTKASITGNTAHRRRLHPQNPHHHRTRLAPRHHHPRRTHLLPDPRRRQLETPPTTRHHLAGLRPPPVPRRRRLLRPPPRQLHALLPRQGPPRRPRRRPQQTDHRRHQRLEPDPPVSPTRHRDLRAHGPGG